MMRLVEYGQWRVRYDPEATRRAYEAIPLGHPESCGCRFCQNFIATRDQAYPAWAVQLFEQLGIRRDREAEVYHLTKLASGLHFYGGFLHFVGGIEAGAETVTPEEAAGLSGTGQCFTLFFSRQACLVPAAFDGLEVAQF